MKVKITRFQKVETKNGQMAVVNYVSSRDGSTGTAWLSLNDCSECGLDSDVLATVEGPQFDIDFNERGFALGVQAVD